MKSSQFVIALCASAALLSTTVRADDGDNVRNKLQELEQQARAAKEAGRAEEAQAIMEKAKRIHAEAGERNAQGGDKLEMTKRKVQELRNAGKGEEAEQLERRIREGAEKQRDGGDKQRDGGDKRRDVPEKPRDAERGGDERQQHLGEAIRHLRAAGLDDPANQIERLAHELGKGKAPAHEPQNDGTQRALRETQEQMAKMARAIDELRQQVEKLSHK